MANSIRVNLRSREGKRIGKTFESNKHSFCRLTGCIQIVDGGSIGSSFFAALIVKQCAHSHFATTGSNATARTGGRCVASRCTGYTGADTKQHTDNSHCLRTFDLFAQTLLVTICQVTRFVGDDTDKFIRCLCLHQCTYIDKHTLPVDKSIEALIVYDDDLYFVAYAGGFENRCCVIIKQLFDFSVADDRYRLRLGLRNTDRWCKHQ